MMRMLTADYFARSPVLILPIIALLLFLGVYAFVVLRTYLSKKSRFDSVASLPLDEGE